MLQEKSGVLDWSLFNFLENLVVNCAVCRDVPPESGVKFFVSTEGFNDSAICVLFKVDRTRDPLVKPANIKRPDFLAVFIGPDKLILTVVEMKGKSESELARGVEQITNLTSIMKREIKDNLSSKLKPTFQGILLTPYNSQIPINKINDAYRAGVPISVLQYDMKANLGPYISRINPRGTVYDRKLSKEKNDAKDPSLIEKVVIELGLPKRIADLFVESCNLRECKGSSFYVNFGTEDLDDYFAVHTKPARKRALIATPELQHPTIQRISDEIDRLGIETGFEFIEIASR